MLGTVVLCYLCGIVLVNLDSDLFPSDTTMNISSGAVPMAILLMLFSSDFSLWKRNSGKMLLSYLCGALSVCVVSACAAWIFNDRVDQSWNIAGMLIGVYTGSTANMAAVASALGVDESVYGLCNMYDIALGGLYLLFVMTIARKVLLFILPAYRPVGNGERQATGDAHEKSTLIRNIFYIVQGCGIAAGALGAVAGLSFLLTGKIVPGFVIVGITLAGIAASFMKKIRALPYTFETGEYFLWIFATAMGLMSDFGRFEASAPGLILMMSFTLFASMILHTLLAVLFRIDADTLIITNVAGIMSPPFVPAVCDALKNREIMVGGLATGILGLALGNLLGIGVAGLVKMWLQV